MNRQETLDILEAHREEIKTMGIKSLALFGSVVRGEATGNSDVDLLVEFESDARIGLFEFARLRRYLGDILHARVDLATPDALHEELKEQILQEAIHAA